MMKMMAAHQRGGCGGSSFRCGPGSMNFPTERMVYEDKANHAYHVSIDLPGVKANNMTLTVEENGQVLRLTATRNRIVGFHNEDKQGEAPQNKIERRFALGSDVDADNISARLENGVLEITVPKRKEPEAPLVREIQIRSGKTTNTTAVADVTIAATDVTAASSSSDASASSIPPPPLVEEEEEEIVVTVSDEEMAISAAVEASLNFENEERVADDNAGNDDQEIVLAELVEAVDISDVAVENNAEVQDQKKNDDNDKDIDDDESFEKV